VRRLLPSIVVRRRVAELPNVEIVRIESRALPLGEGA
jgi:hypothetical protein